MIHRMDPHDDHRRRQHALLRRLVDLCSAEPCVLGLAARGSYARGDNDAFSDLDLRCYLRDEERTGRAELHAKVAGLAPTLSVLYLYDRNGLYLYQDGVRLDLDYVPRSAVRGDRESSKVLLDPDGVLAAELGADNAPEHRAHPRWWEPGDPAYATWFLWMFRQSYCFAKRGAQGGARSLSKLVSAADSIHQARTSLAEMRLWTLDAPGSLEAGDPELASRLARTYTHLTPAELLGATRALLDAYERACPEYCAKAGTPYPADKVAALRRVLDDFDRIE
jgi:predicted nucleotidyltransferase